MMKPLDRYDTVFLSLEIEKNGQSIMSGSGEKVLLKCQG